MLPLKRQVMSGFVLVLCSTPWDVPMGRQAEKGLINGKFKSLVTDN